MKEQIEQNRDLLITHLEQKINHLRKQRESLNNHKNDKIQNNPLSKVSSYRDIEVTYSQKANVKMKLNELQALYEQKKQLQRLGILENDPIRIKTYVQDPYIQQRIQKTSHLQRVYNQRPLSKKAIINQQKEQQKQKILNQQMQNIQKLLNKKKSTKKEIQMLQQLNYHNLLAQKKQTLSRFQQLINKKNSLIQKEQLLQIAFDSLKQWKQKVKKQALSGFLIANPVFSRKFNITEKEVYRDLDVFETQERGFLSFQQFYQFVKSIQLTNPQLNPTQHRKYSIGHGEKNSKQLIKNQKVEDFSVNEKRSLEKYAKRLFSYLDKKKQNVILRKLLIESFKNKLLLKESKNPNSKLGKPIKPQFSTAANKKYCLQSESSSVIRDEVLQHFTQQLERKAKQIEKDSYYKELQGKYIGFEEIMEFTKQFLKSYKNKAGENKDLIENLSSCQQLTSSARQQNSQIDNQSQSNINEKLKKQKSQDSHPVPYPWENKRSLEQKFQQKQDHNPLHQLHHLDRYYHELRQKHANQIEWGALIKDQQQTQTYKQEQVLSEFRKLQHQIKDYQSRNDF